MAEEKELKLPATQDAVQLYIMTTVAAVNTKLADLRQELMGNGQPGRIQRIEQAHEELTKRVDKIKGRITYAAGVVVGVGAVVEVAVKFLK